MESKRIQQVRVGRILRWAVAGGVLFPLLASSALAGPEDRRERQIMVFERALDAMLIESPNWLVRSSEPAYGYYVDDHGAVFSFRASLVGRDWDDHGWWGFWRDRDDDDDRDYDRDVRRQERRYDRGKDEIVDTILDFGEILASLSDSDMLEISVKLRSAVYFHENDRRRLEMKVRMGDLRAYYDGRMEEKALIDKIEITED